MATKIFKVSVDALVKYQAYVPEVPADPEAEPPTELVPAVPEAGFLHIKAGRLGLVKITEIAATGKYAIHIGGKQADATPIVAATSAASYLKDLNYIVDNEDYITITNQESSNPINVRVKGIVL